MSAAPATPSGTPTQTRAAPRVFVYGSCVGRDTIEYAPGGGVTLAGYVARQSLASAFSPPVTLLTPPPMPSPFLTRQARGDYASSLTRQLHGASGSVDLLLWDLTDERLGFYLLPDDTVVTRSVDLVRAGAEEELEREGSLIEFGTDMHFNIWRSLLPAFADTLAETLPHARVACIAVPWAERNSAGNPTPASFGMDAATANERFARYYAAIEASGVAELVGASIEPVAAPDHRWGEAPFHYAPSVYTSLLTELALPSQA